MLTFTKVSLIRSGVASEATIGRFAYSDTKHEIKRDAPTPRLRRRQAILGSESYTIKLEGEILVSKDELKGYEKQFDIFTPKLPVSEPFNSWTDLINAVKEKTPESRNIIRYLEDYGYQDLLKMRREVMVKVGDKDVKQIRWEDFLLPKETAQMAGYDSGADYNRAMFKELLQFAPRTVEPEVYGGRKLMRGATGSKREMKKRVEPMVDQIVAEHEAETLRELRDIFSALPEHWCNVMLGSNDENVQYEKDKEAQHLGTVVETIPSNRDYLEISRLNRVLTLLKMKHASAESIKQTTEMIKEKTQQMSGTYEAIFTNIFVSLDGFVAALANEFNSIDYSKTENDTHECKTSLRNTTEFIHLLDPGRKYGFREDFYGLIGEALSAALKKVARVIVISKDGTVTFSYEEAVGVEPESPGETEEEPIGMEPESPEDAEEIAKARARVNKWKKEKISGRGDEEESMDDIINMIRGEED